MLEILDLRKHIAREHYEAAFRPLRDKLDQLQRRVVDARIPVCVVFEGWDAAGKGDAIEKLVGRLDPRGYKVHAIYKPTTEEALRPFLWRFWIRVPGRGEIAIFDRSWYRRVLRERVRGHVSARQWRSAYSEINEFERVLTDDGTVIVKFWLHISEKEQRRRFKAMEQSKYHRWRITRSDWKAHKQYRDYLEAAEEMLERTSTAYAPWTVVDATDKYYRRITVFKTLIEAMETAVEAKQRSLALPQPARAEVSVPELAALPTVLDQVDLSKALPEHDYHAELRRWQVRLRELEFRCFEERRPVVVACEGWDASGKGGAIKRIIGSLDPRGYTVIPIAAPAGDDATHHYLWRFWTRMPKAGHIAIFDRTWYGRVLVERVVNFEPVEADPE